MLVLDSIRRLRRLRLVGYFINRRALANILATTLCALVVVTHPINHLGSNDQTLFLIITVKNLVFNVQENLAQHIELTILNLTGALLAIGLSCLGLYLHLIITNTAASRAIVAIFLVVIGFTAGLTKSRLPRLTLASRILCFLSIWMLTRYIKIDSTKAILKLAEEYLWIGVGAAVFSLLSSILLLPWTSILFASEIISIFSSFRNVLSSRLESALSTRPLSCQSEHVVHITSMQKLLERTVALNASYAYSIFELRLGRVGVKATRPLIAIAEHIRRELSWGMAFEEPPFLGVDRDVARSFEPLVLQLGEILIHSLNAVETAITETFLHKSLFRLDVTSSKLALLDLGDQLEQAKSAAKEALRHLSDQFDIENRQSTEDGATDLEPINFTAETFDLCLFVISLIEMAHEMQKAVNIATKVVTIYESSRLQLWYPHISWAWLGAPPRTFIGEDDGPFATSHMPPPATLLTKEEEQHGMADMQSMAMVLDDPIPQCKNFFLASAMRLVVKYQRVLTPSRMWNTNMILNIRFRSSRIISAIKGSDHLQHALKNAIGIALLGLPAFLPGNVNYRYIMTVHGPWMIISYVYVLEVNTGATWRLSYLRLFGTLLGAVYAYIVWLIVGSNPYGLVIFMAIAETLFGYFIINSNIPSMGTVALVTVPPIMFQPYLVGNIPDTALELACYRGLMIAAGIIAALIMNTVVFPKHCRVLFLNQTSQTIGLLSRLYLHLGRDLSQNTVIYTTYTHEKETIMKIEIKIRNSLVQLTTLIATMHDELSLMPKPLRMYRKAVSILRKALDQMIGLRKIRENIPRHVTVAPVFNERQEFISCICITLFACEQAFMCKQPLPQFLPSARQALHKLEAEVQDNIQEVRRVNSCSLGHSLVYALAELEAMRNLVHTMHELQDICRDLFGTASWMVTPSVLPSRTASIYEEGIGTIRENGPRGWDNAHTCIQ